jgi:PAS domain S-box-containing protein
LGTSSNSAIQWRRVVAIACSFIVYGFAFAALHGATDGAIAALVIFPVALVAWFWGWRAGLAAGLASIILNTALFALIDGMGWQFIVRIQSPGTMVVLFLGLGVGWWSQLLARLREQSALLIHEREILTREIIERQRVHAALRESEERFREAFDHAAIGMALVAPDGRWLRVNQSLCAIVGYSEPELLATTFQAITHPDDLDADLHQVHQMLAGAIHSYHMEKRYFHKSGRVVWAMLSVSLVRDAHAQPLYFISQIQDITQRKRAETELTQSYTKNYALLEALPDTLFRVGHDGTLRDYKAGQADELALKSALFFGRHVTEVFPPALADQLQSTIANLVATNTLHIIEHQTLLNETLRDYEIRLVSCASDEVLALVRDITERKTVERMKDEFISMVSHELRTPLTAIRGAMGLLAGGVVGELPAQTRAMVDIAVTNSDRLIRLINDLLDIQKIEAGKVMVNCIPQALEPLVEQTIASNYAYGKQFNIRFVLEWQAGDILVNTDADRFTQVLTNLLSNAAKFSPPGEQVVVRVTENDAMARVAVIDHGPGIPEAFQSRIFQKFAQVDGTNARRSGGTGLGLSIAKTLIERLDGRVGFTTTRGAGSTFYIELPIWYQPADRAIEQVVTWPG